MRHFLGGYLIIGANRWQGNASQSKEIPAYRRVKHAVSYDLPSTLCGTKISPCNEEQTAVIIELFKMHSKFHRCNLALNI